MTDVRAASPTSDVFSDGMDSLSMRDKSLIKRSVSKHHNNNFTAGYVPVHEQHLQKTGLRGRKTFAFWTLVGLIFVLAVGNLILTMTILGVLRLGQGMQSLELVPEDGAIKLFGNTDLNDVYKRDGRLQGYNDYPVDIMGHNGSITVKIAPKNGRAINKMHINKNGTLLRNLNSFRIKNKNDEDIFTTTAPKFNVLKHINNMKTSTVHTERVVSPIGSKLHFEGKNISLRGAEGTFMESSEILLSADQDIFLNSLNGSIILTGNDGVFIDPKKMPTFVPKHNEKPRMQYKVCVCMPQGKLFKIPVTQDDGRAYCDRINLSQFNPCV